MILDILSTYFVNVSYVSFIHLISSPPGLKAIGCGHLPDNES